jgi:hypothetical protein
LLWYPSAPFILLYVSMYHVYVCAVCSVCTCQVLEFDGEDKSGHRSRTAGSRRAPPTAGSTSTSTTLALTGGSSAGAGSASGPGTGAKGGKPEGKEADDVTQRFVWRACRGASLPYAPAVQRTPSACAVIRCMCFPSCVYPYGPLLSRCRSHMHGVF